MVFTRNENCFKGDGFGYINTGDVQREVQQKVANVK